MMPSHFDINEVVANNTHEQQCLAYDMLSPMPFMVNPMYSPQEEDDDCDEFPDIPQSLDAIVPQQLSQQPVQQQRSFSDVLDFSFFPPSTDSCFPDTTPSNPSTSGVYIEPRRVSLPARTMGGSVQKRTVVPTTDYSVFMQQLMSDSSCLNMDYVSPIKQEPVFGNYTFDFTHGHFPQEQPQPAPEQLLTQGIDLPLPDVNVSITPPQPSNTPLPPVKEEHLQSVVNKVKPKTLAEVEENAEVDFNGRKHRKWRNRKYKCKHCDEIFYDKNLEEFAAHIQKVERETGSTEVAGRHYKCEAPDCLWHIIGFVRKLEAQKHYDRRHGHPKFQCRFWCEGDKEKYPGSKTCSTRWHVDSGNRARHERAVHGQVFEQSKYCA